MLVVSPTDLDFSSYLRPKLKNMKTNSTHPVLRRMKNQSQINFELFELQLEVTFESEVFACNHYHIRDQCKRLSGLSIFRTQLWTKLFLACKFALRISWKIFLTNFILCAIVSMGRAIGLKVVTIRCSTIYTKPDKNCVLLVGVSPYQLSVLCFLISSFPRIRV